MMKKMIQNHNNNNNINKEINQELIKFIIIKEVKRQKMLRKRDKENLE